MKADISTLHKPDILTLRRHKDVGDMTEKHICVSMKLA